MERGSKRALIGAIDRRHPQTTFEEITPGLSGSSEFAGSNSSGTPDRYFAVRETHQVAAIYRYFQNSTRPILGRALGRDRDTGRRKTSRDLPPPVLNPEAPVSAYNGVVK